MGKPKCVYCFQFDEVRADRLGVNGYPIRQKNIDALAKEGVVFSTVISGSSYTGAATPALWTGMYGPHHGVRDPYQVVSAPLLQEYMRDKLGWETFGCMSQSVAGSGIGMNNGFDTFLEPTDPNAPDCWGDGVEHWQGIGVEVDSRFHAKPVGRRYVDDNIKFIKKMAAEGKSFYLYNQFYETHTGSEDYLVRSGRIKEGVMAEDAYCNAKIQLADEEVIGSVIATLKEVGYYDDALIVITGDHGTTMRRQCWPMGDYIYDPVDVGDLTNTHSSLYDVDLKVPLIIKGPNLPKQCIGKRIEGQVRAIDIMVTVLDLCGITKDDLKFPVDGVSLVPSMENLRGHGLRAYSETVWSAYGMGARQSLREENWKYIRYATSMYEEFFDLQKDPKEQNNLMEAMKHHAPKWLRELREQVNDLYRAQDRGASRREMPEEEKKAIEARLRALGYVQ